MFFTFDLATMIENLKQSHAWKAGELNSMVLLRSPEKNIVLTAVHEGTQVSSYQKNSSLSLQVLEGTSGERGSGPTPGW
jgi:hypothetical protein